MISFSIAKLFTQVVHCYDREGGTLLLLMRKYIYSLPENASYSLHHHAELQNQSLVYTLYMNAPCQFISIALYWSAQQTKITRLVLRVNISTC